VALAERNAHYLELQDRVEFRKGDLLAPFDGPAFHGQVDLLVCNPPYISSRKVDTMPREIIGHEPRLAFDGGPFGNRIVARLIREAPRFLRNGECLAFEVGLGQGSALMKRLSADKRYSWLRPIEDEAGAVWAIVDGGFRFLLCTSHSPGGSQGWHGQLHDCRHGGYRRGGIDREPRLSAERKIPARQLAAWCDALG